MKEIIIKLANDLNIDLIGFTSLKYSKILHKKLLLQEKLKYKSSFQTGTIDEKNFRTNRFNKYKSAIVIGIPYNKTKRNINKNEVYLSSHTYGNDYHIVIKELLKKISIPLKENNYTTDIYVDNNVLEERTLAYEAGLGYFGKNNLLINDKYGSYFFIGVILTDAIFEYDKPSDKQCFGCNKCIEKCPSKAINDSGILNSNICLSYLTQKKNIKDEDKIYFNNCVYGCDICSEVCPHNKNINKSEFFKFTNKEIIKIKEFDKLDKNKFGYLFKNNACSWRGFDIIKRNVEIYKDK